MKISARDVSGGRRKGEGGRTDDSEIFVESVADEDAAEIDEESELLVRYFERDESVSRQERIQIAGYGTHQISSFPRTSTTTTEGGRMKRRDEPLIPENSVK